MENDEIKKLLESIKKDTKLIPDIFNMLENDGLEIAELKQTTSNLKTSDVNLTIIVQNLTQRVIKLEA